MYQIHQFINHFRYLPFPITIPILPKAHDFTIGHETIVDHIFDQNDLDYV